MTAFGAGYPSAYKHNLFINIYTDIVEWDTLLNGLIKIETPKSLGFLFLFFFVRGTDAVKTTQTWRKEKHVFNVCNTNADLLTLDIHSSIYMTEIYSTHEYEVTVIVLMK